MEEAMRSEIYIPNITLPKTLAIVRTQLLGNHISQILSSPDVSEMISKRVCDDLKRLYHLFGLINSRDKLANAVCMQIRESGLAAQSLAVSENLESPHLKGMETTLQQCDHVENLLKICFNSDPDFERKFHNTMDSVVNSFDKTAEYISLHLDHQLRKGSKKTEEEVDSSVKRSLEVFKFLRDKDTIERYYNQHLARRLIRKQSASDECEKQVIGELRSMCGSQFTSKAEKMFADMTTSADLSRQYREYSNQHFTTGLELNVSILTSSLWPIEHCPCQFSKDCNLALENFEAYYRTRYASRSLTWIPKLVCPYSFSKGPHKLEEMYYGMQIVTDRFSEIGNCRNQSKIRETDKGIVCFDLCHGCFTSV
jgi:cullin 3